MKTDNYQITFIVCIQSIQFTIVNNSLKKKIEKSYKYRTKRKRFCKSCKALKINNLLSIRSTKSLFHYIKKNNAR